MPGLYDIYKAAKQMYRQQEWFQETKLGQDESLRLAAESLERAKNEFLGSADQSTKDNYEKLEADMNKRLNAGKDKDLSADGITQLQQDMEQMASIIGKEANGKRPLSEAQDKVMGEMESKLKGAQSVLGEFGALQQGEAIGAFQSFAQDKFEGKLSPDIQSAMTESGKPQDSLHFNAIRGSTGSVITDAQGNKQIGMENSLDLLGKSTAKDMVEQFELQNIDKSKPVKIDGITPNGISNEKTQKCDKMMDDLNRQFSDPDTMKKKGPIAAFIMILELLLLKAVKEMEEQKVKNMAREFNKHGYKMENEDKLPKEFREELQQERDKKMENQPKSGDTQDTDDEVQTRELRDEKEKRAKLEEEQKLKVERSETDKDKDKDKDKGLGKDEDKDKGLGKDKDKDLGKDSKTPGSDSGPDASGTADAASNTPSPSI